MPGTIIALTGQRFGRLVVIGGPARKGRQYHWLCLCDCGAERLVRGDNLRSGSTQSCGCLHREFMAERSRTHGHAAGARRTPEYRTWQAMIRRCHNPNDKAWPNYGGRGITVCARWRESFEAFYADMGPKPEGLTLDRQDNDGNYSKANCRWATPREQVRNTRRNRLLTYQNRTQCLTAWAEEMGIQRNTLWARISRGWRIERALSVPVGN